VGLFLLLKIGGAMSNNMYHIQIPLAVLRHEEMRWEYMSDKDLIRRLGKITKPEKLSAFYQAAMSRGKSYLCDQAYVRFQKLFNGNYKGKTSTIVKPIVKTIVKPEVEVKAEETINITIKRYIDF
jgi:hypothetical protein